MAISSSGAGWSKGLLLGETVALATIASFAAVQRRRARRAEAANRNKDAFLATTSHELRQPMTAILGWVRMLRNGDSAQIRRGLDVIERSANAQQRLIEELDDLSQIAIAAVRMDLSIVDLNDIVRSVAAATEPLASERRLTLNCTLNGPPAPVLGDAMRLQQVLGNLVFNALKFTSEGGRLSLGLRLQSAQARAHILVRDTGIGIEPEQLSSIFEPFWQGAAPSSSPKQGLGLGLSIARHLVELHGGTLHAHSEGRGRGTCMVVTLPLAPSHDSRRLLDSVQRGQ
jgi:signal transduction histidine kinase